MSLQTYYHTLKNGRDVTIRAEFHSYEYDTGAGGNFEIDSIEYDDAPGIQVEDQEVIDEVDRYMDQVAAEGPGEDDLPFELWHDDHGLP